MKTWSATNFLPFILGSFIVLMSYTSQVTDFQKVVSLPTFSLTQLRSFSLSYLTGEQFTDRHQHSFRANADSTTFTYQEEFMVYNRSVLKHPVGKVSYRATLDLKEEKIRYSSDSVFFREYFRNRYSRYVPANKPPITLGDWKRQWTGKQPKQFQSQLESSMEKHLQDLISHIRLTKETKANDQKLENW